MTIDSVPDANVQYPVTRAAALARLDAFLPEAGAAYARLRNHDQGPNRPGHVSRLSAALRRRVISEAEVVDAVVERHGLTVAGTFVSEVFWRTYWKGWLEQRPAVWPAFRAAVTAAQEQLVTDTAMAERYLAACEGRSGIDCFDAWVSELEGTGYLHNWARMQVASIWTFTLDLPWELGAEFMYSRLIDADPASNVLSWRWVAGLHTAGKAYLADAERITAMTDGRFQPTGLARRAAIPRDSISVPSASTVRAFRTPDDAAPTLLLLTVEDLSLERQPGVQGLPIRAIAHLPVETETDGNAMADAVLRAHRFWPSAKPLGPATSETWQAAHAAGCGQVVTGFTPVGPVNDRMETIRHDLEAAGLRLAEHLRRWDHLAWPHCRQGFFALKKQIPPTLAGMER